MRARTTARAVIAWAALACGAGLGCRQILGIGGAGFGPSGTGGSGGSGSGGRSASASAATGPAGSGGGAAAAGTGGKATSSGTGGGKATSSGTGGGKATSSGIGGAASSSSGGGVTTSGIGSGGGVATTGTGGGPPLTGACVDAADQDALTEHASTLVMDVYVCGEMYFGQGASAAPLVTGCIATKDGLTSACASCYTEQFACGAQHCTQPCLGAPNSPACASCVATNCGAALAACSLLPDGQPCTAGTLCASIQCVGPAGSKICCDTACTGTCQACTMALTGQPDGTCADVTSGTKPPAGQCPLSPPCGNDGLCAAGGVCELTANGVAPTQIPGDCQQVACHNGTTISGDDPADVPATVCLVCSGSPLAPTPAATGTNCTADGVPPNHVCGTVGSSFQGKCVECNVTNDCLAIKDAGPLNCVNHVCQ